MEAWSGVKLSLFMTGLVKFLHSCMYKYMHALGEDVIGVIYHLPKVYKPRPDDSDVAFSLLVPDHFGSVFFSLLRKYVHVFHSHHTVSPPFSRSIIHLSFLSYVDSRNLCRTSWLFLTYIKYNPTSGMWLFTPLSMKLSFRFNSWLRVAARLRISIVVADWIRNEIPRSIRSNRTKRHISDSKCGLVLCTGCE